MSSRTNSGDGGPEDHFDHPAGTGEEEGNGNEEEEGNGTETHNRCSKTNFSPSTSPMSSPIE